MRRRRLEFVSFNDIKNCLSNESIYKRPWLIKKKEIYDCSFFIIVIIALASNVAYFSTY